MAMSLNLSTGFRKTRLFSSPGQLGLSVRNLPWLFIEPTMFESCCWLIGWAGTLPVLVAVANTWRFLNFNASDCLPRCRPYNKRRHFTEPIYDRIFLITMSWAKFQFWSIFSKIIPTLHTLFISRTRIHTRLLQKTVAKRTMSCTSSIEKPMYQKQE